MSHDFEFFNKKTNKILKVKNKSFVLFPIGGTIRCDSNLKPLPLEEYKFNMTYNYTALLKDIPSINGSIEELYGKPFKDIQKAIEDGCQYILKKYTDVMFKDILGAEPDKLKYVEFIKSHVYDRPKKKPSHKQLMKQKDILDDYWAITPMNVYKSLHNILVCIYEIEKEYKSSLNNITLRGD